MGIGRNLAYIYRWLTSYVLVPATLYLFGRVIIHDSIRHSESLAFVLSTALVLQLVMRLSAIYGVRSRREFSSSELLNLESLLVMAVFFLIQLFGATQSPLYPLLWLLLAGVGGLEKNRFNLFLVIALVISLESLSWYYTPATVLVPGQHDFDLVVHLASALFFPFLSRILIFTWAQHLRLVAKNDEKKRRIELDQQQRQQLEDAKQYRLDASETLLRPEVRSSEKRVQSSLESLKRRVHSLLVILNEALRPNTIAFLLLNKDQQSIKLMDSISNIPECLVTDSISAKQGVIGAILRIKDTISFNHVREDPERFHYYNTKTGLKTFMGVPICTENQNAGKIFGVLLADRTVDIAFGEDDEMLLKAAAQELVFSMDTERVISATETLSSLLHASEQLNRAIRLEDVVGRVLKQVHSLLPELDFAAIALCQQGHTTLVGFDSREGFLGFSDRFVGQRVQTESLCCQTIQTCSILPEKPFHERSQHKRQVFGSAMPLDGLESLKCLPLIVGDGDDSTYGEQVLGTLVVGSQRRNLFPADQSRLAAVMRPLEIIINMGAISIQNAQRWQQLERLATTDGLTGLHNHRRFKEMLEEAMGATFRYQRSLSMILADIDHFKQVNDTYGHPMGDQVLKKVAGILLDIARATDKVCRYGGEEFAVILPETDLVGARMLSERFREEIKAQLFEFEGTRFKVTLSLGICTAPEYAGQQQELIDRADQALYHAKHSGRDKTIHFADIASRAASGA